MIPELRNPILNTKIVTENPQESIPYNLQQLLQSLHEPITPSNNKTPSIKNLSRSFGWDNTQLLENEMA